MTRASDPAVRDAPHKHLILDASACEAGTRAPRCEPSTLDHPKRESALTQTVHRRPAPERLVALSTHNSRTSAWLVLPEGPEQRRPGRPTEPRKRHPDALFGALFVTFLVAAAALAAVILAATR